MQTYNVFTGAGFDHSIGGNYTMFLVGLVIVVFAIILARKWVFELMSLPFNMYVGIGCAVLTEIIVVYFTGSPKISMVSGLAAGFGGGYLLAGFLGDTTGS